jgi:hypothetical protein
MIDKNYIHLKLQEILDKEFNSNIEKKIITHEDRFNFRCPYCHEGKTKSKKRGNLYFNKLLYICFRCSKKTNLDKLVKDFNILLDPDKKMEIIEHLNNNITYQDVNDDIYEYKFDKLINLEDIVRIFNTNEHSITEFKPIVKNGYVYKYLVERGIPEEYHFNIYEGKHWLGSEQYEKVIIFLNKKGNKVLGAQMRNLKEGKKRSFSIFNFETLYKWVNNIEEVTDIELPQLIIYNKLSYYFNILNVDLSDKITIFEGYIDSLFYPNSIGLVGVSTDTSFLEAADLELQYLFDNDIAGYMKSEQKIRKYPVFLWKKLFQDIVDKKKSEDPYKLLYRISKVKDLNKLAELVPNPFKKLNLETYFSQDVLDIKWIPKKEYIKKIYNKT